jgi:hypothetical protein
MSTEVTGTVASLTSDRLMYLDVTDDFLQVCVCVRACARACCVLRDCARPPVVRRHTDAGPSTLPCSHTVCVPPSRPTHPQTMSRTYSLLFSPEAAMATTQQRTDQVRW